MISARTTQMPASFYRELLLLVSTAYITQLSPYNGLLNTNSYCAYLYIAIRSESSRLPGNGREDGYSCWLGRGATGIYKSEITVRLIFSYWRWSRSYKRSICICFGNIIFPDTWFVPRRHLRSMEVGWPVKQKGNLPVCRNISTVNEHGLINILII